nr:hypothetical protein CFP56_39851 [Quercus suber]
MKGGKTGTGRSETVPATASVGNVVSSNVSENSGKSVAHQSAVEFAATLQEIGGAINEGFEIQILNKDVNEVTVDQDGKKTDMEMSVAAEDADINSHDVQLTPRSSQLGEHVLFTAGWVENDRDKKGRRGGACGIRNKIQASDKGPSRAIIVTEPKPKGTWVRMNDMPRSLCEQKIVEQERPKPINSFFDLVWHLMMREEYDEDKVATVVTIAWSIWANRNGVRHGGTKKTEEALVKWSAQYLTEYRSANGSTELVRRSQDDDSEAPPRKLPSCGDISTGGKQRSNEDKDKVDENGLL